MRCVHTGVEGMGVLLHGGGTGPDELLRFGLMLVGALLVTVALTRRG